MTLLDAGPRERVDQRERADDRPHAAVESELAEHRDVVERAAGSPPAAHISASATAELETRAGLAHRRGREVHGDPLLRILESRRQQRGPDALARLAPGRVGQADDRVAGQAPGHVDLDGDDSPVDPFEHGTANGSEHDPTSFTDSLLRKEGRDRDPDGERDPTGRV